MDVEPPPRIGMKDRLIRAAREELTANRGLIEIQHVARRAGVSVGIAYHHFGSKAGLIAAVVEDFHAGLETRVARAVAGLHDDWAARERARMQAYLAAHFDDPLAPIVVGRLSRSPEVIDVERAVMAADLAEGARNIRAGQRAGVVRADLDPELTVAVLLGGVRQALLHALEGEAPRDIDQLADRIWTVIAGALGLDPAATTAGSRHVATH